LRIDHVLLSPALAPRLRDAGVDRWVRGQPSASDHAPTWVDLAPAARATKAAKARAAKAPKASKAGARRS
jgi:exodeoxyribonuclease-3